jgi:hypothetical protein
MLSTWDDPSAEAAAFATDVGRERLIGMSHSEDRQDGVITVWYWDNVPDESPSDR